MSMPFNYESAALDSAAGVANHTIRVPYHCHISGIRIVRTAGAAFPAVSFFRKSDRNAEDLIGAAIAPAGANQYTAVDYDYTNGDPWSGVNGRLSELYVQIAAGAGVTYVVVIYGTAWDDV